MATGVPHRKAQRAAMVLGIGLGGFVDGIVLHQIVQWHNMLSNWMPPTTLEAMHVNDARGGLCPLECGISSGTHSPAARVCRTADLRVGLVQPRRRAHSSEY